MKATKFQIYQAANGLWAWRLKAGNGEIVAHGETYQTRAGALRGVKTVIRAASVAVIVCDPYKPAS